MKSKNRILQFVNLTITAALIVFAYNYISDLVHGIEFSEFETTWPLLFSSALLFVISYCFFSLNWLLAARTQHIKSSGNQVLVFFASQPYKYLPTSLFILSSRAVFAKKLGLTIKQSLIAQIYENLSIFLSNFILFGILFAASVKLQWGILGLFITFLATLLLNKNKQIKLKVRNKTLNINTLHVTKMLVLTTLGWLFAGLAFVVLSSGFDVQIDTLKLLAANTIAFSLGMLIFFAPGGIGIREVVYRAFAVSAIVIIYWRILVFVLDMISGIIAIVLVKYKSRIKFQIDK